MVFVLAEAGRKKLTTLVLGSDQERALRQAAAAAVPAQPVDRRPLARGYERSLAAPRP